MVKQIATQSFSASYSFMTAAYRTVHEIFLKNLVIISDLLPSLFSHESLLTTVLAKSVLARCSSNIFKTPGKLPFKKTLA